PRDRDFARRSHQPWTALDLVLGYFLLQSLDVSARGETKRAVSRGLPPQQQVLGSAGGLPIARRQPARRPLSVGLCGADRATAAGLAAAIPAVLFYNYLSGRVKLFASEMDDFAMEFLNICERNFTS